MAAPLKPVADDGVADRQREEDEAHGQHDEVEHVALPFKGSGANSQIGLER